MHSTERWYSGVCQNLSNILILNVRKLMIARLISFKRLLPIIRASRISKKSSKFKSVNFRKNELSCFMFTEQRKYHFNSLGHDSSF